jgi:hypothetical protein
VPFIVYLLARADIALEYPKPQEGYPQKDQEIYELKFNWNPASMSQLNSESRSAYPDGLDLSIPRTELLMTSVVHHRLLMQSSIGSSNTVLDHDDLCTPTLHGFACPVSN